MRRVVAIKGLLLITLGTGIAALSQTRASSGGDNGSAISPSSVCPMQIIRTYIRSCKGCDPETSLRIEIQNTTNKTVTGILYGAEYEDAVGTKREYPASMVSSWTFLPGKTRAQDWNLAGWLEESHDGALVWLKKVRFGDGSTWEGEGRACQVHTIPDPAKTKGWWGRH
jgi:hypothetical protein